jgi:hypothetical protein
VDSARVPAAGSIVAVLILWVELVVLVLVRAQM